MGENFKKFLKIERQEGPDLDTRDIEELTDTRDALINFRLEVRQQILRLKQKIDISSEKYKKIQEATKGWPEEIPTSDLMNLLEQGNAAWGSKSEDNRHLKERVHSARYKGKQLSDNLLSKIQGYGGEELNQFINNLSQKGFVSKNFESDPLNLFFLINQMENVVGKLIKPYKFRTKKE